MKTLKVDNYDDCVLPHPKKVGLGREPPSLILRGASRLVKYDKRSRSNRNYSLILDLWYLLKFLHDVLTMSMIWKMRTIGLTLGLDDTLGLYVQIFSHVSTKSDFHWSP